MLFSKIGAMNIGDLDATPNYDEATDGSYAVFGLNNGMQLVLSCVSDKAMLIDRSNQHCVTYHGRAAECERSSLLHLYFGGDQYVETEAPSRMS